MKILTLFILLLFTSPVIGQSYDISRTEKTIIIDNGLVSTQISSFKKEGTREWYDTCEQYEWNTPWGKGSSVKCNWSEQQAMETALNHAPNGLKVEWFDRDKRAQGYVVISWSRPLSNQGWCRHIEMVRQYSNSTDKNTHIMCPSSNGWQRFRGH
jgi:hypothetical protein